jgi:hypothetical protein
MYTGLFAWLGKEDGGEFAFQAPRWWRMKSNTTRICLLIDNEFRSRNKEHNDELKSGSEDDLNVAKKLFKIVITKLTDVTFQDKLIGHTLL